MNWGNGEKGQRTVASKPLAALARAVWTSRTDRLPEGSRLWGRRFICSAALQYGMPGHRRSPPMACICPGAGWTERGRPVMWASCHRALTQCHRSPAAHTSCRPPGSQTSVPPACSSLEGGAVAGWAWSSGQGWAPVLLRYSPWDRLKMTEALKVSPAPRVSTTRGGGKASEWSSRPSGPRASAPSSAQAQTSVALQDPPFSWVLAHPWLPASFRLPRADPGVQAHSLPTPKASSWPPPAHPFLTRLYKPFRASAADRNPKCLATSLLTNTCGQ